MQFEWAGVPLADENKRQANIEKHGIDFADAVKIFDGFTTLRRTRVKTVEKNALLLCGILSGLQIAVIYTPRNGKRRIISVRRARVMEH